MPALSPDEIDCTAPDQAVDLQRAVVDRVRPAVLRGLVRDWPACHAAARSDQALDHYLRGFADDAMADVFVGPPAIGGQYFYGDGPAGFNFERVPATVAQALDLIAARVADPSLGSAYLGSLPTRHYLPGFAEANPTPGLDAGVQPRIWIGNASRVAAHYDTFDNLACVIAGRRRFTLYPPDAIGDLYVGPIDHTMAGQPVSLAAADPDNDDHYPRFARARARALVADLAPGDALYLPKLWWHQVEATGPFNAMINCWWDAFATGPDAPMLSMLLAMIAIGERPAAERANFRAFFDHYVFRPDGHPLAHLPEDGRGILRAFDRAAYGRIRAMVMRGLRGE
jgi:hypothetical protein